MARCAEEEGPTVKNIKLGVKVRSESLETFIELWLRVKPTLVLKQCRNFCVFSCKSNKIILFPNKGYINITGIPDFCYISSAISNLCELLTIERDLLTKPSIHNITLSGRLSLNISLFEISNKLQSHYVRFDYSVYPGLHLKVRETGSVLLFSSGKYSIIGVTCICQAVQLINIVNAAMHTDLTMARDLKCVSSVVKCCKNYSITK